MMMKLHILLSCGLLILYYGRAEAGVPDSTEAADSAAADSSQAADSATADSTQADSTQVDSSQADSTQVDSSHADSTQVDSSQAGVPVDPAADKADNRADKHRPKGGQFNRNLGKLIASWKKDFGKAPKTEKQAPEREEQAQNNPAAPKADNRAGKRPNGRKFYRKSGQIKDFGKAPETEKQAPETEEQAQNNPAAPEAAMARKSHKRKGNFKPFAQSVRQTDGLIRLPIVPNTHGRSRF